jgi:hypothetical protein
MMIKISYSGYRFPPEIIQQAIWLYLRFTLSFRDVEDLLAERGIIVSYETVRRWVNHFGPITEGFLIQMERRSLIATRVRRALSHYQIERVTNLLPRQAHAVATTSRHVCMADALKARCVLAEVRWSVVCGCVA